MNKFIIYIYKNVNNFIEDIFDYLINVKNNNVSD